MKKITEIRRFAQWSILCFFVNTFSASAINQYFEQYFFNEGLSQSTVKVIYRDTIGILWIGTKEGLNRYDGQQMCTYVHDTDENSLPGNNIYTIVEDARQTLWIGTNGGLCSYHRQTDSFKPVYVQQDQILLLQNLHVTPQALYGIAGTKLWSYNYTTEEWKSTQLNGSEDNFGNQVQIIALDTNILLIGSRWKGLFLCDIHTGNITPYPTFDEPYISNLYQDKKGQIWISVYNKGLYCLNIVHQNYTKPEFCYALEKIMSVTSYHDHILVGTDGQGIMTYCPNKDSETSHFDYNKDLPTKSILTLYVDAYDMLWVGTIRSGMLSLRNNYIKSYNKVASGDGHGLSNATVLSFFEDENGYVWIGTDGEGINRFSPAEEIFTHYPTSYGHKISSITGYSKNQLLTSAYDAGFLLFNKQNGQMKPLDIQQTKLKNLFSTHLGRQVYACCDTDIYLYESNLYSLNPQTEAIVKIDKKDGVGSGKFYRPVTDADELILFDQKNIYRKKLSDNSPLQFVYSLPDSLRTQINAVDKDRTGNYWIGAADGLYRFKPESETLHKILEHQLYQVSTLVIDQNNTIWLGVGNKLCWYHIDNNMLYKYSKADGVSPNEYLPNARLIDRNGNIYLGGVMGFSYIEKDIPLPQIQRPTFVLRNILLDGSEMPTNRISETKGITNIQLPWNYTTIVLNLFINTPTLSNFPNCRYLLKGQQENYSEITTNQIRLQHMQPGKYTIQMQYEQDTDSWSTPETFAILTVDTPWWNQWWFYSFLGLMAIGMILFWKYRYTRATELAMEQERQKNAQELSEQKIRFLINVSHELRTPLVLVCAPMKRILSMESLSEELKVNIANMYKHVKNMKNIIDMVLDIRKMEIKHETLNLEKHAANEWIKDVISDFELEFKVKNIQLETELDNRIMDISFDRERCNKVLSNLIMNAIKFTETNGTIRIKSELQDNCVCILVEDNGCGIAPEDVPNLFIRFYQTQHQKGGSGIGLSYAKTQIEMHGGKIGYKAAPSGGSIFWFTLPIESNVNTIIDSKLPTNTLPEPIPAEQIAPKAFDFSTYTILIAEDELDLLHYLKEILSPLFKKVIIVKNGKEALQKVIEFQPDIVVSDVMMPLMDGFELCRTIKSDIRISHIPIILLTALNDSVSSLTGYKMGADKYLAKPFEDDLLLTVLSNTLAYRNQMRALYNQVQIPIDVEKTTFSNADEQFMQKLLKLIDERIADEEIKIDYFASGMAMSRSAFYLKIKQITGKSANAFMQEYKINKAIQLLSGSDLPIIEISEQLGFTNQRYFSTVFKQLTGTTPREYRKEKKERRKLI